MYKLNVPFKVQVESGTIKSPLKYYSFLDNQNNGHQVFGQASHLSAQGSATTGATFTTQLPLQAQTPAEYTYSKVIAAMYQD